MFDSIELSPPKRHTTGSVLPRVMPIIEEEAAARGYTIQELIGKTRDAHLILCRHYAIWRAKRETGRSLPEIGRAFGGRDHSTILYAVRKIEAMSPEVRGNIGRRPPVPPPKPPPVRAGGAKKRVRRNPAKMYETERTCIRCGGTLRYERINKCAPCEQRQREYRWRRQEAKRAERREAAE